MKIKIKIIGVILIGIGIIVVILFMCGAFDKKYPTFDEIEKLYIENAESFNIANTYLINQKPDENGIIYYDKKKLRQQKNTMPDKEYGALESIFGNKYFDYYYRNVDDSYDFNQYGHFSLKTNRKDVTISLCCITGNDDIRGCKHINENWYAFYYSPPND